MKGSQQVCTVLNVGSDASKFAVNVLLTMTV